MNWSVHPHARGDGVKGVTVPARRCRFTPRAWGRRGVTGRLPRGWAVHPHQRGDGSRKPKRSPEKDARPVHPHARGDGMFPAVSFPAVPFGSPPRVWGRRAKLGAVADVGYRFTPTRVGTAGLAHARARDTAVHPHARGDGAAQSPCAVSAFGSPPRAWGRRRAIP